MRAPPGDYPPSWYALTRMPAEPRAGLAGLAKADVAIVGGGFAGLHLARLLALRGRRVAVLERQRIGWGASGRNGGFVSPGFAESSASLVQRLGAQRARALFAHSQAGVRLVEQAIAELGRPELLMGRGQLTCCRSARGRGFGDEVRALAETLGAAFEPWTAEQVQGALATSRYHQAIHDPQAFQIHPLNLALALAADVVARGGQVFEGTGVDTIARERGAWVARTAQGRVEAAELVLAGNADLGPLHRTLVRSVLPVATYVAVTEPLGRALGDSVRWGGAVTDTRRACDYFRVVDGDRLLWGGRITTDTREPPGLRELMRRHIVAVFPQLSAVKIAHAWPGVMGYARHKMPFIGQLEPGLWMSSAYGGHGVGQTAAGALLLADAITEGDDEWRRYQAFPLRWAGGAAGRMATQVVYWWMQARDLWDEWRAPPKLGGGRRSG
ncbi:NAD(P)/FAD-dependent oxidoreductase [Ideonella sp. YS5]|uniref:NAD(P)/FAD-dependent oxidoreductase n=1 Tax=Ideonella sp. YS5 TaxID=3453714 RepID=UPI003EE868D3